MNRTCTVILCSAALITSSLMAIAPARAEWYWRHPQKAYSKPIRPPEGSVITSESSYWVIQGTVEMGYVTKLADLGLSKNAVFVLNGTVLGDGPFADWTDGANSTVRDLCNKVNRTPGGPFRCDIGGNWMGGPTTLSIVKEGEETIEFKYGFHVDLVYNPVQLFGGEIPVRGYRRSYSSVPK